MGVNNEGCHYKLLQAPSMGFVSGSGSTLREGREHFVSTIY
jgi:hypothetical protein